MRTAWGVPRRLGVLFIPNVIGLPEIQSQRVPVELLPFRNVSCRGDAHLVGIAADNPRRFYMMYVALPPGANVNARITCATARTDTRSGASFTRSRQISTHLMD